MKLQTFGQAQLFNRDHLKAWARSLGIRRASGGHLSHVGALWTATCGEVDTLQDVLPPEVFARLEAIPPFPDGFVRFWYESTMAVDGYTGKDGVRGPYDWREKVRWHHAGNLEAGRRRKNTRRLELVDLPLNSQEVRDTVPRAAWAAERIRYCRRQIWLNWKGYRLRRGIHPDEASPDRWTCPELVVQLLDYVKPRYTRDALRLGYVGFDMYCPSGTRGPGLWEMIQAHKV